MRVFAKLLEPYGVLVFDDVFEEDVYRELMRTFPVDRAMEFNYAGGKKLNFNQSSPGFFDFLGQNQLWNAVYDGMPAFGIDTVCPDMGVSGLSGRFKFEFSMLPSGGGLMPHPDSPGKKMTGVFYFTPDDWDGEWGGDFEVVSHLSNPTGDFTGTHAEWDSVETVMPVRYKPNRAVFMVRTPYSLHGVRNIRCPEGKRRLSVTVNWL